MSELQNFDQFFKKKMEEYSPPVPEHIWANIVAEKDKRRPVALLFKFLNRRNMLLVAAMLLLIAGSIFTFTHTAKQQINQTTDSVKTNNSIDDNTTTQHTTGTLIDKTKDKETAISEDKTLNTIKTDNTIGKEKANGYEDEESGQLKSTQKNREESNSVVATNVNQHHAVKSSNKKVGFKSSSTAAIADEESTAVALNSAEKNNTDNSDEFILFKMLYYPEKNKAAYSLKSKLAADFLLPPCPEIEKNAAGNKDYIEAYIGPDFAYKSYTDTSNSLLMQKRKESISFHSAFSAGFRYTRVFSNGVSIRGGINYSQINEKFTYVQSNIVQVTYIIDPATGDTTGSYITNGSRYKTTYNHYRTIDIPVVFGFETGNGRIHANLNAGMVFNIRSWQNGETIGLDSALQPVIVSAGKGNTVYQYKTNIGAGFTTAASIYYKLNDRFHLLAEPYWRYNFSPMSKEALSLQEKYSVIGLRLGLRMDLQY